MSAFVYGIFMLANSVLVGARSTSLPPYITADLVGVAGHDAEVVGDEDHRHVAIAALLADQFEDLGLHGDVEGGGRLVGEQDRRATGERDGDHHALAHAARQLVRVLVETPFGLRDADVAQELRGGGAGVLAIHVEVELERLGDLLADLHQRVQRVQRVLEHHRHLGAPEVAHLLVGEPEDLLAGELAPSPT